MQGKGKSSKTGKRGINSKTQQKTILTPPIPTFKPLLTFNDNKKPSKDVNIK